MLSVCKVDRFDKQAWHSRVVQGVDLSKLDQILDGIDYSEVRKRKLIYSRLFHEASITHEHGLGISFTDMLTLLAHHKLIVDAEALVYVLLQLFFLLYHRLISLPRLHDLVTRTETNRLVTDLVNLDRVRSLLKTISHRRRFLSHLERKRAQKYENGEFVRTFKLKSNAKPVAEIPSIVVEAMPGTPPLSSRDIASAGYDHSPGSPSPVDRYSHNNDFVLMDTSAGSRLQRSSRRTSDYSTFSADTFKSP